MQIICVCKVNSGSQLYTRAKLRTFLGYGPLIEVIRDIAKIFHAFRMLLAKLLLVHSSHLCENEMCFRLQLSTSGKLRNGKKNALVAFSHFCKANKAQYQHQKIRHFLKMRIWREK